MGRSSDRLRIALVVAAVTLLGASPLAAGDGGSAPPALSADKAGLPGFAERMESALVDLVLAAPAKAEDVADANGLVLEGDRVLVEALAPPGEASAARARIGELGGSVEGAVSGLIEAQVPVDVLAELSRDPAVGHLQVPLPPLPDAALGEGIADSGAGAAHASGVTGAGVEVTIMDVGFSGYARSAAAGEVPSGPTTLDLCTDINSSTHGTWVAEIVHEMAPDAQLSLACTDTSTDMAPAAAFAKSQGAQIISRSLGDTGIGRGDGSGGPGTIDAIAEDALANGILWVNSAGNYAHTHWSGGFSDPDSDNLNNFTPTDELNSVSISSGQEQCFRLKWDAWPTTDIDYDVRLYRSADSTIVDSATSVQNGTQAPREFFCYTNPGPTQSFGISIVKFSAPAGATPRIDLFAVDASSIEHAVAAGSITDTVGAPEVLSVAAFCRLTGEIQSYSSQGPTIDGRTNPDIGGPTPVSTSFLAGSGCNVGFAGTSAAAPHVAGAAALYKQALGLDAQGLRAKLEGTALERGAPGKDNVFGNGALRVLLGPCAGRLARIVGSKGNDVLRGTNGPDTFVGLEGNDRLIGRGGRDRICGGLGNDKLLGGAGSDTLLGQAGRDRMIGGAGKDRVKGGAGRDVERP